MITILTGLPRSGKSYRAVWQIYETFINPKSKDFKKHHFLYTNIGGFKHDVVNDMLLLNPIEGDVIGSDEIIKESIYLDWNTFYPHICKLHEMAKADKTDDELLRYARYHKLTPAFIVIDEAYRFYTKKSDPVLVWLNGYHGHLGLDLLFIIHRPSLMHSDYKAHTEEFIDAQPKSKSLTNNTFRYYFYATDTYNKENKYASDKLTADQNIFALYKSGDLHKPKKILYKYIGIMAGAVAFIGLMAYFFIDRMGDRLAPEPSEIVVNPNDAINPLDGNVTLPKSSVTSSMLLRVRCDDLVCCRVDSAYQVNYIPKLYFEEALKMIDSKLLAGSTVKIFNVEYKDSLYSIPSDSIAYFSMWNIPLNQKTSPKSNFSSTGDVYKQAGV
jgi:zona occludens toxin